jgi:hypothetical protein
MMAYSVTALPRKAFPFGFSDHMDPGATAKALRRRTLATINLVMQRRNGTIAPGDTATDGD